MSLEHGVEKTEGLPCPAPISRLRVEKIEGGLVVAGVVVAANCQVALPVFGCLFVLVGIVLTVASYRGPGQDEAPENYAARLAFTGNSRILGPACIAVGLVMLSAGIALCILAKRARRKERRVGFHCPIHGDFFPLSPVSATKSLGKYEAGWGLCFGRTGGSGMDGLPRSPPQCPHTQLSSTRSSFSLVPISPCPTPVPFLVASNSISSDLANSVGANVSPDQTFGSIRSLSVSREVASFPLSRTPSPPNCQERARSHTGSFAERNCPILQTEDSVLECHEVFEDNADNKGKGEKLEQNQFSSQSSALAAAATEMLLLTTAQRKSFKERDPEPLVWQSQVSKGSRKSVSIILPDEDNG